MINTYKVPGDRRIRFEGAISDMDVLMSKDPMSLASQVRAELVSAITDHLMKRLTPIIDEVIEETVSRIANTPE